MAGLRFGTDGVRGVAGSELTPEAVLALSAGAGLLLRPDDGRRPLVAVGRDTRPSGDLLVAAAVAGLTAAGADVALLGVVPTPAVARAVADGLPSLDRQVDAGLVVSASHNPMPDNGIKLVGRGGVKLPESVEREIEAAAGELAGDSGWRRHGLDIGRVAIDVGSDHSWYVDALAQAVPTRLSGLRVVVDCANGSAATVAEQVYARAGADVVVIHDDDSGVRINDGCGATHLESLQAAVVEQRADAGIAHDGDADRCLAVTAAGDVVDGDAILAVLALALRDQGRLPGDTVVATVMSNLGLHRALAGHGVSVLTTPVGDRHVTEAMRAGGFALGGEQSGHVVVADRATTGDGLLTGLMLLERMAQTGAALAELAGVVVRYPQVLVNVAVADRDAALERVAPLAAGLGDELGDDGRVLVRPSGTEPLLRIMVEASDAAVASAYAERLAALAAG